MNTHDMRMSRSALMVAFVVFSLATQLAAQEPARQGRTVLNRNELNAGFETIFSAFADVNWQTHFTSPEFQEREVQTLSAALKATPDNIKTIFASKVDFSVPFLASLTVDYKALIDLRDSWRSKMRPSRPLFGRVYGAAIDIRTKAEGVSKYQTDRIQVSVRTLKPGTTTEVQGCYVWYAPFYDDREANWDRFGPISSPSKDQLPEGIWVVWSRKGDKSGRRERLTLDGSIQQKPFDIDAPE